MRMPEAKEKDKICAFLKSIGAWYFRPYMAGFGKRGVPDIIACIDGRLWGIEVKQAGLMPTKLQMARMQEIRQAGGRAVAGCAETVIHVIEHR